jgi:hypothetical protein
MKLFEGGILDKITNDEYEKMVQSKQATDDDEDDEAGMLDDTGEAQSSSSSSSKVKTTSEKELTALSLQMLQGAFYLALIGYCLAFLALLVEIGCERINCRVTLLHFSLRVRARMMGINRFRLW